ncbi:hypothetical protein Pfo_002026 [Paulownia fortunei]|nr:hypothetical protein Pfo_002026 [Paulownia fortunei]
MSSSGQNNSTRKGKGRQKVNMVKIENETNLQVTFSKRRAGLFKKASELSTLCGAETAVVVFSPGNKAHSFGHPNVETISNRFLNENVPPMSDAEKLLQAHHKANISQHTLELNQVERQLELEQKRANELEQARKDGQGQQQCPPDINKLDYQQLQQLKGALLHFSHDLEAKVQNVPSFTTPYLPGPVTNLGREEIFQRPRSSSPSLGIPFNSNVQGRHTGYGNRGTMFNSSGKLVLGGSSAPIPYDGGAGSSNALVGINPRANRPNVTTPYDPAAGRSCLTIPYSSTASSSNANPKSPSNF